MNPRQANQTVKGRTMNRIALVGLAVLLAVGAFAAPTRQEYGSRNLSNASYLIGGEHAPLIYSGSDTISSSANFGAYTTNWLQIGFAPTTQDTGNKRIFEINPEKFTLVVLKRHAYAVAADSCYLSSARFEIADSSSATVPFWNTDSSNLFVATGNYNRTDYGAWTALPDTFTERAIIYPLKVYQGAYIRFVFETVAQDCTIVIWTLKGEN